MKQLLATSLFLFLISMCAFSRDTVVPRQKIDLLGETLPNAPQKLSVKDMEALKNQTSITIFDPYNKNLETVFYGFYLKDFVKAYGKSEFKILRVAAIDGYKVDIPKTEIDSGNLFMSYKDNAGYLTVDRMGPARIIAPAKGIINKDLLLKIGVYWVWQVKSLEFIK